jgi:hypothetical protein
VAPACLVALACLEEAEPRRKELVSRRETGKAALGDRFERAKVEGDLPAEADAGDLARYVMGSDAWDVGAVGGWGEPGGIAGGD